ncbi:MAG: NTP transferase domain-containing protein [Candidatus Omnitrophica bacterium]|nr:NTP transferase domain-containing protein [Candidatus Omnitrophota bacterium]
MFKKEYIAFMKNWTAVVLAAGRGTRMESDLPKVLHDLKGKPLIYYVLKELVSLKRYIRQIIVVVGYQGCFVEESIKKHFKDIGFAYQKKKLGTADAVRCVQKKVKHQNVLVLCGDAPLITKKTLSSFIAFSLRKKFLCSLISAEVNERNSLGRIIRDREGRIKAICEKGEPAKGFLSNEVNSGIYAFDRGILFNNLKKIKKNKKKGEYFLTDIVEILYEAGYSTGSFISESSEEILGINTLEDLCRVENIMRMRILDGLMAEGVRIVDSSTTFIEHGVKIGKGTLIYPFTFIEKDVIIGGNCFLGPFIHLRSGSRIKNSTCLGNFVEVNRSVVGPRVKMKHFGYLGDTTVESDVNVGAGVVVANFDGKSKNKTYIRKNAFIGSDTVLVAPVKVGKGAVTGAGSVVTKDVRAKEVVAGVPARPLKKSKVKNQNAKVQFKIQKFEKI